MDPQVCGKLLTLHRKGNGVDEEASVIESPSGRTPKKAPRWDLMGTEGCGGGKVFWGIRVYMGERIRSGDL